MRKDLIITALLTFCLAATLFTVIPTRSQTGSEYDPWKDVNDDGKIDILDITSLTSIYGAKGKPINKTELLLNLQEQVNLLSERMNQSDAYYQAVVTSIYVTLFGLEGRINSFEYRVPKKGYISISPVAFSPEHNTQTYSKTTGYLSGQGPFFANVQLPDKAIITNITVSLIDLKNNGRVGLYLMGFNITRGNYLTIPMAGVETTDAGMPGSITLHDDTISDAEINNKNCEYSLYAWFSSDDPLLAIYGIVIEYEFPL